MKLLRVLLTLLAVLLCGTVAAQAPQVLDLPTRPGVTLRMLVLEQPSPTSVVVLISGGAGQLDIAANGYIRRDGNFLVRSRGLFADRGHTVVLLDTPSDRSRPPYLGGDFRESPEHAADLGAVVTWARTRYGKPVWLVGTSRGTHSAATAALQLQAPALPDGVVLTSTIMGRSRFGESTARPLTELDLTGVKPHVLVVHHEQDPCGVCPPAMLPELMKRMPAGTPLHTFTGGLSRGGACDPFSHHGFNGIEDRVVEDISSWIRSRP
jgi:alpha-beta hydrolase superfamily lysophospholipase